METGIYKIENNINHKIYIGSAVNFDKRIAMHLYELRKNIHANGKLQNSFNKYGEKNFSFTLIEKCKKESLLNREQYYIDTLNPFYNICDIAGSMLGYKYTKEQSEYMSKIRKGKYPEMCRNKNNTVEAREKISLKAKLRIKQNGINENFRIASIKANTGRKHTEENIKKRILKQIKLSQSDVIEIRKQLNNGIFQKDIAKLFNVSQRVICKIKNNIGIYGTF